MPACQLDVIEMSEVEARYAGRRSVTGPRRAGSTEASRSTSCCSSAGRALRLIAGLAP